MKENLFSYGTLQKEKVQIKLFGRLLHGTKDRLNGYKLSSIEIKDESFLSKGEEKIQFTVTLTHDKKDSIEGTVFEIREKELLLADSYEPRNYKRIRVKLETGKKAWIYVLDETN